MYFEVMLSSEYSSQNYIFLVIWSSLFLATLIALKCYFLYDNKVTSQVIF